MSALFSSREIIEGRSTVNGNSPHTLSVSSQGTLMAEKPLCQLLAKPQVKQPTAEKPLAKIAFPFNGTGFQPEILTARCRCKLFAKPHTICSTWQLLETSVELNYNTATALILSIPAFIVIVS